MLMSRRRLIVQKARMLVRRWGQVSSSPPGPPAARGWQYRRVKRVRVSQ